MAVAISEDSMDFFYYFNRPCPLCARYRVSLCRNMIICDDCAWLAVFLLNDLYMVG